MQIAAAILWIALQATAFASTPIQDRRDLQVEHKEILREIARQKEDAERYVLDIKTQADRHSRELLKAQEQFLPALNRLANQIEVLNVNMSRQADIAGAVIDKLTDIMLALAAGLFGLRQTKWGNVLGERRGSTRRGGNS